MVDDALESAPEERIDLRDPAEIRRWREIFGVTEEELKTAVRKAGTSPKKVREALRARGN
jgi:hypothetical protein